MKRTQWFALALGLLVIMAGGLTQLASADPAPAPARAPILDPFIDVWIDGVYNLWPAVAYNSRHDEYLVAWAAEEVGTTDGYDILGRRLSGAGVPLGSGGFTIAGGSDTRLYTEPAVDYSPGYGYLVAWSHDVDPGPVFAYDVGGRYVMPGQNQAAGNWFILDNSAYAQTKPDLACDPLGDCLVIEEDEWSPVGPAITRSAGDS